MSVWVALFWGAVSAGAVLIGQALAPALDGRERATGMLMGFGAGTLLSVVAYELVPESALEASFAVAISFAVGALTYFALDHIVDGAGGQARQNIARPEKAGGGAALFIGALLDGIPESFILGIGIAQGSGVSVAFLAAVFFSNLPEGAAGTLNLEHAGTSSRTVTLMWVGMTITGALMAAVGFLVADDVPMGGLHLEAFAGGAMLVMLADSMMPEAFEHGGKLVGLLTVAGFLVAGILSVIG